MGLSSKWFERDANIFQAICRPDLNLIKFPLSFVYYVFVELDEEELKI